MPATLAELLKSGLLLTVAYGNPIKGSRTRSNELSILAAELPPHFIVGAPLLIAMMAPMLPSLHANLLAGATPPMMES